MPAAFSMRSPPVAAPGVAAGAKAPASAADATAPVASPARLVASSWPAPPASWLAAEVWDAPRRRAEVDGGDKGARWEAEGAGAEGAC
jgi:hypothetical protein